MPLYIPYSINMKNIKRIIIIQDIIIFTVVTKSSDLG